jgi:hypothetical protein
MSVYYMLNCALKINLSTSDRNNLKLLVYDNFLPITVAAHELSSLSRTLGSWVPIPLKAWMSVCAFILCLCCPVCS